jgi:flagellar hook-associated protein 1 FlgK
VDPALGIAASSLDAATTAIAVTSENIANANTPGYVNETAQMAAIPGGGMLGVGDGVQVTDISLANNALLATNNWQAQGALANLGSLQQMATAIEDVFPLGTGTIGSSTGATDNSLAGQLANFWSSWDGIATSPSSLAPRTQVVDMAQGLASTLNQAATQLTQLSSNSVAQLGDQVSQVNALLTQAAALNQSIVRTEGAGASTNQLTDQMNNVVGQLSQLVGANAQMQSNGTADINVGGITVPVSGGSVAGLLLGVNQYIPEYQNQLNGVANALATTVNTQLAAGYTASGVSGATEPLFVGTGAAGIAVNSAVAADPTLIAAATTTGPGAVNDGSNAQAMAELGTVSTGPDAAYQNLVQGIGTLTQGLNSQVASQTAVANQANQSLQAVTGVDQNTQLTNLLQFQQVYQASAKLLSIVDAAVQSLMAAV